VTVAQPAEIEELGAWLVRERTRRVERRLRALTVLVRFPGIAAAAVIVACHASPEANVPCAYGSVAG
jgi:hypothetical protein